MRHAVKDSQIQEVGDNEPDFELVSPNAFFGSHINAIPLHSAVQGPRLFYGARFFNQAMPVVHAEAALVQNLDDQDPAGRSFDEQLGEHAGAMRARVFSNRNWGRTAANVVLPQVLLSTSQGWNP